MTPAFLDANVFIYAAGRDHPLRAPSNHILSLVARRGGDFVTSAEVFQEVFHRYLALRAWPTAKEYFWGFLDLMEGRTEPLYVTDVLAAARLADRYARLSARDLVHAAVMIRLGVSRIVSADTGFDQIEEIERLDPARVEEWASGLG